jgi:hypothetical protein
MTLDDIEKRIAELTQAEREAWLEHIARRWGIPQTQPAPVGIPYPAYPLRWPDQPYIFTYTTCDGTTYTSTSPSPARQI